MAHIAELMQVAKLGAPQNRYNHLKRNVLLGGVAALGIIVAGGSLPHIGAAPDAAAAVNSAVPVTVAAVEAKPVRLSSDFSGRLASVDTADIRPEVGGRITEIRFKDGQTVHAGDILFVIDPRPYEAAVAKAEADLAAANANAHLANIQLERAQK